MKPLAPFVVNALDSLQSAFLPDELAYLALTQKVEHAIRDSLAFRLHCSLDGVDGLLVCREWNRTDLAVVQGTSPLLLLEAKAVYTFDIVKDGAQHQYPDQLENDYLKAAIWQEAETGEVPEVLLLLIATHPHNLPGPEYRQAVKYYGGVAKYSSAANTLVEADSRVRKRVPHEVLAHGVVPGGQSFGIGVSIGYWLFAPRMSSNPSIERTS